MRLALEANLLPSIFDTKAQDMWLGRRQRTASEAQRVALIARDQGCIGCKANPLWCRAHHIVWWSKDGSTDLENLALVCDDCHHKIHDHGWQVHKQPDGRYGLKPPAETSSPANPATPRPKPRSTPLAHHNSVTIPAVPHRRHQTSKHRRPGSRYGGVDPARHGSRESRLPRSFAGDR